MSQEVSSEVHAHALYVAESLRDELQERLIGKTAPAWSCSCGVCSIGPSKVVGIGFPKTYQIARWGLWGCNMEDDKGNGWSQGISPYIPCKELYPMFRNRFAGIEVEVDHPFALFYSDRVDSLYDYQVASEERKFINSGRTVVVSCQNAVYVRPIGSLANTDWLNAELRIDANLEGYPTTEPLLACNVDPFEFGQRHGRGSGRYFKLGDPSELPTLYNLVSTGAVRNTSPIARLVAVDKTTGETTFELDQTVESFNPASDQLS